MVIWGTFGIGVGRMGRRVARVTTVGLTEVVMGVVRTVLSVLLVGRMDRVDVLFIVDGEYRRCSGVVWLDTRVVSTVIIVVSLFVLFAAE